MDILLISDAGKGILLQSSLISEKTTRTAAGVTLFSLKPGQSVVEAVAGDDLQAYDGYTKCRKNKIPATGVTLTSAESGKKQLSLD